MSGLGGVDGAGARRSGAGRVLPPLPGLDGLRGLAVLAVVAYHSGFGWARGGWLGVSAFFTLSGYLITTLLLAEVARDGRVSLPAFGGRRVRRLLPALLVTVAGVVVIGRWAALPSSLAHLRGDAWATLGQVANWHFLIRGQGYGAQFEATSPLLHTWSLSIEAQAYLLLPLVVVGVARFARARGRTGEGLVAAVAVALGALLLASLAAGAILAERDVSLDRLYFGTDVRLAELLAGSMLAVVLRYRPVTRAPNEVRQGLDAAGLVALAVGVFVWAATDQADRAFYPIGLWAHAAGAAVVVAAVRAEGVTSRLLSVRPLRVVGHLSYGIYLYHWPIFTWLTPERSGWPEPAVHAIRWALTLGLAAVSFRFLEEPIRRRRGVMRTPRPWLAPLALGAAAALVLTVTPPRAEDRIDFGAAADELEALTASPSSSTAPAEAEADVVPPRVAFVGDSTALINALGLGRWSEENDDLTVAPGLTQTSCGLLPGPDHRMAGARFTHGDNCPDWSDALGPPNEEATLMVVNFGAWDMAEHLIDGAWGNLGDPPVDAAFRREMEALSDAFIAAGRGVVWLLPPTMLFGTSDGVRPAEPVPASDPARLDRFRQIVGEVVAARPGHAATLDLRTYLEDQPGGELDTTIRPDLVHFTPDAAAVMATWLGPELVRLAGELEIPAAAAP